MDLKNTLRLVRQYWTILGPRRWLLIAVVLLIVLASFMEGVSFSLIVPLMQVLASNSTDDPGHFSSLGFFHAWLVSRSLEERLAWLGLALIVAFGFKNVLQYWGHWLSTRLWLGFCEDARRILLVNVLPRPLSNFLSQKQGTLVQQLYAEPQHVSTVLHHGIELLSNLIQVIVLGTVLVIVNLDVTATVVAVALVFGFMLWWLAKRAETGGKERQEVEEESIALLTETIGGIRQIKVFSAERRIAAMYDGFIRRYRDLYFRYWTGLLLPPRITELFWVTVLFIMLMLPLVGGVKDYHVVLPMIVIFSVVAFRVGPYVSRIYQCFLAIKFHLPAVELVGQLLEKPPSEAGAVSAMPFTSFTRSIQFQDVSFGYGGGGGVLHHVSLQVNRGEVAAIIGPSGAGKSTLVDLLVRLYEPSSGTITVDDIDLCEYDASSWLASIGFVSQDTFVFHASIRDNIAFGKPAASREEIKKAALQANAHEFIMRLPGGYDTVIGDRGFKLSGGERQRLAIARALLRNPQILILDEATSALDNQSEAQVQEALTRVARDRTVIIIAHRLSSVIWADKIVVLDQGRVAEMGSHAALIERRGLYWQLYGREAADHGMKRPAGPEALRVP
jgi:ABC-type multidrug transport system fused ATPase/permease subunit